MTFTSRLLATFVGTAGLLSTATAGPSYSDGNLLLGFRATSNPGATQAYVVNLGPATQFTEASAPFVVPGLGNVAADLAIFSDPAGAPWFSRPDVFWGLVGTDLPGDPANTLYATRPRDDVATQTAPWTRRSFSSQSTTNSTIRAFISGFTLSDSNANSTKGTIQSTSASNNYAQFTAGGTDFGFFSGIEGDFTNGTTGSVLDLYRLAPTTQNTAGAGLVFVGTFQLNDSGQLTFSPAPPTAPNFRVSSTTYGVNENAGSVTIRVVRGGLTTGADMVQFDTSNGSALAGTDYTAKTGITVNFAAGETQQDVTVDVAEIPGLQPSRTFNVTLSNPSTGTLVSPNSAIVTITDSAPQDFGQIAFSAATYTFAPVDAQAAPNTLAITLQRTAGTDGAVSIELSVAAGGTLQNGTDFDNIASPVTIQFAEGEATKTFNIQLAALADSKLPGTINLSLGDPQGGTTLGTIAAATVTVTARDKKTPSIKLTSKGGKVSFPAFAVTGLANDDNDISRVEVVVNGGAVQLATLGALGNGSRDFDLSGIALENGNNSVLVTAYDASGNPSKSAKITLKYANERSELAGTYNGLITPSGAPANENTGYVTLKVATTGLFTGKVTIGGAVLPIKGIFDNAGNARFNVKGDTVDAATALPLSKKNGTITTVFGDLALLVTVDKVTGTLKDAGLAVLANVDADRAFFDGKTPATSVPAGYLLNKGAYTVVFPARPAQGGLEADEYPQGDGSGILNVTPKGIVSLKGTLADGTKVSAAAPLSKDLHWPLFAALYKKLGLIAGVVEFNDTAADSDLAGIDLIWIRPADSKAKYYPEGWPNGILIDLLGSKYASNSGTSVLPNLGAEDLANGNAELTFTDGKLAAPITETVNISPANKVTNAPADKSFSLKVSVTSGALSGSFTHGDSSKPKFTGAILQKGANAGGFGFFLSAVPKNEPSGQSGAVTLQAK